MKRILSFMFVLVVMLSMLSTVAFAEEPDMGANARAANVYRLATHYGYYEVAYGTVVGYGNVTSGTPVKAAQASLKTVYEESDGLVACNPGTVDGAFGGNTYNAIYNFQSYYGLGADGRAGDQTFAKLQNLL